MRAKRKLQAFTLAELTIVVLVTGILVTAAAPSLSGVYDDFRLRGAATRLIADLGHARNLAITTATPHAILFDANGYKVVEYQDASTTTVVQHPITHRDWSVNLSEQLITHRVAPVGAAEIRFDEAGAPPAAVSVILSTAGFSLRLNVQSHTGRVTIEAE